MNEWNPSTALHPRAKPRRRFFWRHWRWMILLCVIFGIALLCGGLVAFYFKSSAGGIRASETYQYATARTLRSPDITKFVGAPVSIGKMAIGSVKLRGDAGEADFYFNLAGKWRSGMVHVVASRSGGKWSYSEINFIPTGGGGQIDLAYECPSASTNR